MQDDPDEQLGDRMIRQVKSGLRRNGLGRGSRVSRRGRCAGVVVRVSETPAFTDLVSKHGGRRRAGRTRRAVAWVRSRNERTGTSTSRTVRTSRRPTKERSSTFSERTWRISSRRSTTTSIPIARPPSSTEGAVRQLPAYLPLLRERLSERGQELLEELNADMATHDRDARPDGDVTDDDARSRAMVGIYYYEDSQDGDD